MLRQPGEDRRSAAGVSTGNGGAGGAPSSHPPSRHPPLHPPFNPNPGRPRFAPPPGSCDTHFHTFGPGPGSAGDATAAYSPVAAPMQALDAMHRALGIERGVLVQNMAAKRDYPAFIAELRSNPRLRGTAVMDDTTTEADLDALHEAGVRSVRFHFCAFLNKRPTMEVFRRSLDRIAPRGWHVLVHCEGADILELGEVFAGLKLPVIIDHIAHTDIALGIDQPAFRRLLELQRMDHVWIKIANSDRWSVTGPPSYADAIPFGRALIANGTERLIWGTDWPHVMYRNPRSAGDPPPDEADLLNLLYDFAPDPAVLKRILVDNPAKLYPF